MANLVIMLIIFILTLVNSKAISEDPDFISKFNVHLIKNGTGQTPRLGNKVVVHYVGRFYDTGKVFDSTIELNEPVSFILGKEEIIKCFDIVVARMSLGERIKVTCPYQLAYGVEGAGGVIPPKANLDYDIRLVHFERVIQEKQVPKVDL